MLRKIRPIIGPFYPIFISFFVMLAVFSLSRIVLLFVKPDRITTFHDVAKIMINGMRIDIVTAVYGVVVPVLLAPFLAGYRFTRKLWNMFLAGWFGLLFFLLVFMESITPTWVLEYDVRPNRLFVEYLKYPHEVISMLWKGFFFESSVAILLSLVAGYLGYHLIQKTIAASSKWNSVKKICVLPLLMLLLFAGARSSFGHRALNPSSVAFASDALLNDLTLNSSYSLLYAIYRMGDELNAAKIYGTMDSKRMIQIVRKKSGYGMNAFTSEHIPTLHFLSATENSSKKYNLVIILEESMGAEFVGSLGGLPLTPHLDQMSNEGIWFDRLYATGTRSVRGIEALIAGFLPTPGRSVVKLGNANKDFFTIASLLSGHGYHTQFIYGGESNFDDMKRFFLNNGFHQVVDQKNFNSPKFVSSWGVSDDDLFTKADALFRKQTDAPFFSLVFTSSNHAPFEFPDNAIDLYEMPKNTVHNAVKYADQALFNFFKKAKRSSYWDKTIFLVIADHNSRVYGNKLVPIERFRIPGLIIGPGIKPWVYKEIASQIDMPPTLLSFIGISDYVPLLGRDLTKKPSELAGRAILQFYQNQAYLVDGKVIVLQPQKKIQQFEYRQNTLFPVELDPELSETALAHALWASWTYRKRLYPSPDLIVSRSQ